MAVRLYSLTIKYCRKSWISLGVSGSTLEECLVVAQFSANSLMLVPGAPNVRR